MARVIAREISTPARRSWPTAHGSCPAARCEAPAVAQRCLFPFPTRRSSDLSRSFRALSIWHGSLLGKFRPRLGGVGPRLTARALRLGARPRPWLKAARFLPFSHSAPGNHVLLGPLAYGSGHCLGNFDPGSAELAHGSRLVPCGSVRAPGLGSRLPVSYPFPIPLRAITFF